MTMPTCFECKLPVLGLRGQDTSLDTFYLRQADQDILDAGAYGDCHLLCLATSKWVERWVAAIRSNLEEVRRFPLRSSGSVWIFEIRSTRAPVVLYPNGRVEFLKPDAVRVIANGGSGMNVIERRMVEFDAIMRAKVTARRERGSLSSLLGELGVCDKLLEPAAVDDGAFHVTGFDAEGVELELEYRVEFEPGAAAQIRESIRV